MLSWTIYLSLAGAALLWLLPESAVRVSRIIALAAAAAGLCLSIVALLAHPSGGMADIVRARWIPSLGAEYHLAADGISLALVLLTGIVAVSGVLFSWNVERRAPQFFAFYLALVGGVYGVFLSADLLLLFVFYEIAIVPKYFLIAIWGSTRREYGAMKLALYSFAGSAMVLVGILAAYVAAGAHTLSISELAQYPFPIHFQMWAFPLVFTGFAVLAGMWPLHSWAPTGHVAAPTAASMLLAGVVMKLGAYGCLRVAMTLFPLGLSPWGFHVLGFGSWRGVFAVLALVGILYGAAAALVANDWKFVVGYSSVSHMGLVLLGLMTLNDLGVSGAVLQMFSHGVIGSLLFAIAGRMIYERTHTRELAALGAMRLGAALPFAAATLVLASAASAGLPGFSGFVAELQVLLGSWRVSAAWTLIAGLGIVLGVAYTWRAMQLVFFSDAKPISTEQPPFAPITLAERAGACLLLAASLLVGLFPQWLLGLIATALHGPLFDGLRHGGWR